MINDYDLEGAERRDWQGESGAIMLIRVPPRVCIIKPEGRTGEGEALFWRDNDEWLVTDDMFMFFDGSELTLPGAKFISLGSSLTVAARPKMTEYHVLVANVMIEMVAKTISLSMGGFMTIHRAREPFDAALTRALEAQRSA